MAQLTITEKYPVAKPGMLRGNLAQHDIDGRHILSVAAARAGTFVTRGASAGLCKPPTSAAEVQNTGLGFLVCDMSAPANGTSNEYAIGADAPAVKTSPGVWCIAAETLAFGDPVFVIHASSNRGQIRNDADTANAAQLYGARVEEYVVLADGTKLALVSLMHGAVAGTQGVQGAQGAQGAQGPQGTPA
jgi:hypothetical protein